MKVAVIGRGTAGAQTAAFLKQQAQNHEIVWYYDPNIPTQAVGEGSTIQFTENLRDNLGFTYDKLQKIDGSVKTGIHKSGWGKNLPEFTHTFPLPHVSLHFNARALQDYVLEEIKDDITVVEQNVDTDNVDADYIIDCSGAPQNLDDFYIPKYIPVNSVHVTQCYWDMPRFTHTLTLARPYGWVFGIPLQNRCSIGYLYNKDINTLEEVKEDVKNIFEQYNLEPSEDTNTFNFKNYYRKENFTNNISYNGNSSFFLEPLEATSVGMMNLIQHHSLDIINTGYKEMIEYANNDYIEQIESIERMIMLHYFAGSNWNNEFWEYAQDRGRQCMLDNKNNPDFKRACSPAFNSPDYISSLEYHEDFWEYGSWTSSSFYTNINKLGIKDELEKIQLG